MVSYEVLFWSIVGTIAVVLTLCAIIGSISRASEKRRKWEDQRDKTIEDLDKFVFGTTWRGNRDRPNSVVGRLEVLEEKVGIVHQEPFNPF